MRTFDVEVDGCRLRVREAGQGPALLLLHGLSGSGIIWPQTIAHYAARWRVIAPDLPGHGRSAKPVAPYTIDFFAGMLRSLGRALGVGEAVVVGVSLGGRIALQLAIDYPHWTRAVAAVAPANDYSPLMLPIGLALGAAIRPAILRASLRRSLLRAFHDPTCDGAAIRLRDIEERFAADDYPAFAAAMAQTIAGVVSSGRMDLAAIRQPTLLLWGRDDRIVSPASAGRLQQAIPQARLVLLDACGHLPMLERADPFHAALDDFLATVAVAPTPPAEHRAAGGA